MMPTIQLGALAAFIVVLVPMGLAGYHLSRNKVLFFSGALFISLAIAVHLSPYFPSLTTFLPSQKTPASLVVFDNPDSCLSFLHHIFFTHNSSSFDWPKSDPNVMSCDFQKVGRLDAGDLLNGSWVMFVGDSQTRLLVQSLLNLILVEDELGSVRDELFKRHSDYHLLVNRLGLRVDFIWAPYVRNLTRLVFELSRNQTYPDVLVMGSGLWHMLHVTDSIDYYNVLKDLGKSVRSLDSGLGRSQPHLFWLGLPMLVNSMLNTEEKKEKMSVAMEYAYNQGLHSSNILRPRGPFVLLDLKLLSEHCGVRCTDDGMHYHEVVFDAVVHIMLNALLIQSQQKL